MESVEDCVCLLVFVLAFPLAFNDTSIVAIELEVVSRGSCCKGSLDQKLKSNSFCPSNVTPIRFPPWDELPYSPPVTNHNSNATARAGVRVGFNVDELVWSWDYSKEVWEVEGRCPPPEIL